jgi:RNA polymerase sigma-70 factor (ECF subfamily)
MPKPISRAERFEGLYVKHCPAVRRYLRRRADAALVEDTVSETFLVAWRRLDAVPDDALPWLLGVARRALANQRRAAARRERLADLLAAEPPLAAAPTEQARAVLEAIAALPATDREVLMLVCWEGLDSGRAARVLGTTAVAVRLRLHRARRRLSRLLTDDPKGELHAIVS